MKVKQGNYVQTVLSTALYVQTEKKNNFSQNPWRKKTQFQKTKKKFYDNINQFLYIQINTGL